MNSALNHVSRRRRGFAAGWVVVGFSGWIACAANPPPPSVTAAMSPSEEAEAIEAARRHPIALTHERPGEPRPLPVAPAKLPPELANAEPSPAPQPPPPQDQVIIVGDEPRAASEPPQVIRTEPRYAEPGYAPEPGYAAEPGYVVEPGYVAEPGYAPGPGYAEVDGGWVAPSQRWGGYVDGVWVSGPAWRWGYRPGYRPRVWTSPPSVVVVPGPPARYYGPRYVAPPRYRGWGHHDHGDRYRSQRAPDRRRDVHVPPPATNRERGRSSPTYRAPPSRSESRATPRSDGRSRTRSAPSSGRRSVHVGHDRR